MIFKNIFSNYIWNADLKQKRKILHKALLKWFANTEVD